MLLLECSQWKVNVNTFKVFVHLGNRKQIASSDSPSHFSFMIIIY